MKHLLDVRKKSKARKPNFMQPDSNRINFKSDWRKPRGHHNKRRLHQKGHQKMPSPGFGSPALVRGLHPTGLKIMKVYNLNDLHNVKHGEHIIEIPSSVGLKNKIKIIEACKLKNIPVSNFRDVDKFIAQAKENFEARKHIKSKKLAEKKKSKEESLKKAQEKKAKEDDEEGKKEKVKEDIMHAKQDIKEDKTPSAPEAKAGKTKDTHRLSTMPGTRK